MATRTGAASTRPCPPPRRAGKAVKTDRIDAAGYYPAGQPLFAHGVHRRKPARLSQCEYEQRRESQASKEPVRLRSPSLFAPGRRAGSGTFRPIVTLESGFVSMTVVGNNLKQVATGSTETRNVRMQWTRDTAAQKGCEERSSPGSVWADSASNWGRPGRGLSAADGPFARRNIQPGVSWGRIPRMPPGSVCQWKKSSTWND